MCSIGRPHALSLPPKIAAYMDAWLSGLEHACDDTLFEAPSASNGDVVAGTALFYRENIVIKFVIYESQLTSVGDKSCSGTCRIGCLLMPMR